MQKSHDLFDSVTLWAVIATVVVAPTQYGITLGGQINVTLVDPLIWGTAFLWGINRLRKRDFIDVPLPPLVISLFVVLAALSAVRGAGLLQSAKDLIQLIEYFILAYILFTHVAVRRMGAMAVARLFLAVASVVILIGVIQYLTTPVDDFAVGATFGNRNVYGGFLSLCLPLFLGMLIYDNQWRRRMWYAAALLLGLATTLSGATMIAVAVGGSMVCLSRGQRTFLGFALVLVLLLGVVLPRLPRENTWELHDSIAMFEGDGTPAQRYPEWQAAFIMAQEHPLLGVGIGHYQENVGRYYGTLPSRNKKAEADTQNLYLVLASSIGFPGLLAFTGVLGLSVLRGINGTTRVPEPAVRGCCAGSAGALIAFSINSIWAPLLVRGIGIPLILVMVLASACTASRLISKNEECDPGIV
ncbi:MAG: O-antigen ligase family protein [Candidatus Pacebacteria bacterium]|nr:O-antigen ligase family protein [Candidatus Paceibacterota bacterium]